MNLKVLPLQNYQKLPHSRLEGLYFQEIEPIYNRDGWYSLYKNSWFEVNGRAYLLKPGTHEHHKYIVEILSHIPLTDRVVNILKLLSNEGLLSKSQKELLIRDQRWKEIHGLKLSSCKSILRFKKREKERKANGKLHNNIAEVKEENRN